MARGALPGRAPKSNPSASMTSIVPRPNSGLPGLRGHLFENLMSSLGETYGLSRGFGFVRLSSLCYNQNIRSYLTLVLACAAVSGVFYEQLATETSKISEFSGVEL